MENLRQGLTHVVKTQPGYTLLYLMPENDIWKDKAMVKKVISCPKFVKNNADARKKFILDECKFHWLDP
jgi:spore cortex formation protein SpoVR/YcgB (stage V sporulation)